MDINELRSDFPVTYGDGRGHLIDWSGMTGVAKCYACGHTDGPYFSVEETKAGATAHRYWVHSDLSGTASELTKRVLNIPVEAIAESTQSTCMECSSAPSNRGLCSNHYRARVAEWRVLLGQVCSFPGCGRAIDNVLNELCMSHAKQLKSRGELWEIGKRPITHGTQSGYQYHGCRCDLCRAVNTKASQVTRATTKAVRYCTKDGCDRAVLAKGLCAAHYEKSRRPAPTKERPAYKGPCEDPEGCDRPSVTKHLCSKHYQRAYQRANPRNPKGVNE